MTRLPLLRPLKRALFVDAVGLIGMMYLYLDAYLSRLPNEEVAWHVRGSLAGLFVWAILGTIGLMLARQGLRQAKELHANPPAAGAFFRSQMKGWVWFARLLVGINAFLVVLSGVSLAMIFLFG